MLVQAHQHVASRVAAGLSHLPGTATAFAATQAAWRFFNNERLSLPALAQPLRRPAARPFWPAAAACLCSSTTGPRSIITAIPANATRRQLTHEHDIGYEMATALLVAADDGAAFGPSADRAVDRRRGP